LGARDPKTVAADRLPDPPPSLDRKRAAELTACTEAALMRQRRELNNAIEQALERIPWPLRGPVRRIMAA
jgi:hypothetical protein